MNRALSFLATSLPLFAEAQYRWLGSRKEKSFRDFVEFIDWRWALPAVGALALFAFIAKRRWWHGMFVWTPTVLAMLLVMLLGTRTLVGIFLDRVDAERHPRPAVTQTR